MTAAAQYLEKRRRMDLVSAVGGDSSSGARPPTGAPPLDDDYMEDDYQKSMTPGFDDESSYGRATPGEPQVTLAFNAMYASKASQPAAARPTAKSSTHHKAPVQGPSTTAVYGASVRPRRVSGSKPGRPSSAAEMSGSRAARPSSSSAQKKKASLPRL